jgi:micrococcal nuclease
VATFPRGFRRRSWRRWRIPLVIAALVLLRLGCDRWRGGRPPSVGGTLAEGEYQLVRVVDGDTLVVEPVETASASDSPTGGFAVRLLGVDCPESVHPDRPVEPWALEAARFTREFVAGGRVWLRFDRRRVDKYQRRLAYVLVHDRLLNEELLRAGLARTMIYPGDSETIARRLRAAEQEARRNRRGLWGD